MRTLIIRPGAIGDTLLAFPVIRGLQAHSRGTSVTLVGNRAVLPLAQAFGIIDEGFDYSDTQWSELFASEGIRSRRLRALLEQMDTVICWLRDPEQVVHNNLKALGVPRVIVAPGRPADDTGIHVSSYLAQTVGVSIDITSPIRLHEVGASSSQLSSGGDLGQGQVAPPHHDDGHEGHRQAAPPHRHPTPAPMVALHPGSGGARKCWPVASFVAVAAELMGRDLSLLLLAGPADHERLYELLWQLAEPPREEGLAPYETLVDAPLLDVARRLVDCQVYLGNDSGITHLAALLGTPTIALFGPTDPAVWRPPGPAVHILRHQPLAGLAPAVVMDAIATILT